MFFLGKKKIEMATARKDESFHSGGPARHSNPTDLDKSIHSGGPARHSNPTDSDKSIHSGGDDATLIVNYKQTGDLVYIGELYKKYAKQVLGVCIFYFKDKDEAKDHVMQIFDKLIIELKDKQVDNFKGWLGFVVRNYCISVLRKQKTEKKRLNDYYEHEYTLQDEDKEMALSIINDEELTIGLLKESLNGLKKGQKECIELFYLKNKSYHEIVAQSGYSLNEVKSYIQNGKRNLKITLLEKKEALKIPTQK